MLRIPIQVKAFIRSYFHLNWSRGECGNTFAGILIRNQVDSSVSERQRDFQPGAWSSSTIRFCPSNSIVCGSGTRD